MNNLQDDLIDTEPEPKPEAGSGPGGDQTSGRRFGPSTMLQAGLAGVLAGAGALAFGELVASSIAPVPGPVIAVANRVVDNAPTWFVDFGKAVFGLADKPALVVGTVLISLVIAAGLGVRSLKGRSIARAGFGFFGFVGFLAIGTDAQGGWVSGLAISALSAGLGASLLEFLISLVLRDATSPGAVTEAGAAGPKQQSKALTPTPINPPVSRRGFLNVAGVAGVSAALAATGARELRARSSAAQARSQVEFTAPVEELNELEQKIAAANASPVGSTPDISPIVVPNDDFYLIDTALTTPQVDPANWSLTIRGMVDNELTITYDELLERAETVAPVTLSCVSNEVGGGLVGNAVWRGVPLVELLEEAGVQPGATQIASRSVDGWSCGFPTEAAFDGRTALVAVGMNDEPLPLKHGFPARLVVSGLYGYVSATKWLREIELTTLEDFDGYWIPRGWSKLGPVKTQSRIDTPRTGQRFQVGETVPIAGVAWAPDSGITKVEVQVDDGPWQEATLGESLGADAWIQWLLPWQATAGIHIFRVRATDATGETQTEVRTPVAPNGASGWHAVGVEVV
jgi:DMSO/TMAO reductase YedYZ molybdopterin-dependent catalytic subunit